MILALGHRGDKLILEGLHPRKELLARTYATHIDRFYRNIAGKTYHVGYIVQGQWYELFDLTPRRKEITRCSPPSPVPAESSSVGTS